MVTGGGWGPFVAEPLAGWTGAGLVAGAVRQAREESSVDFCLNGGSTMNTRLTIAHYIKTLAEKYEDQPAVYFKSAFRTSSFSYREMYQRTTSDPKGVILTKKNVVSNIMHIVSLRSCPSAATTPSFPYCR